jgi:hypothetical protein
VLDLCVFSAEDFLEFEESFDIREFSLFLSGSVFASTYGYFTKMDKFEVIFEILTRKTFR